MTIGTQVYLLAFAAAFAFTAMTLPLWKRVCWRYGIVDDPGERKIHSQSIPLAGGLSVMTGLCGALLLGWLWLSVHPSAVPNPTTTTKPAAVTESAGGLWLNSTSTFLLTYGFGKRSLELLGLLVGAAGMLIVGCLDDRFELKPLPKFGAQLLIALVVAMAGVRITLFVPSVIFSYAISVLWIVTLVNAFNFMDNMNGLCAGLGAIAAIFFGLIAALKGQYLVALLGFTTFGALVGFLPYNYPKAQSFLGDGGSHLVGFLMAVLAILPHFYTPEHRHGIAVLTPLFVLAVPLVDLAWVVLLRWKMGKPFYQGDTNHLSHRLVRAGLTRPGAVALIWGLAVCAGLIPVFF